MIPLTEPLVAAAAELLGVLEFVAWVEVAELLRVLPLVALVVVVELLGVPELVAAPAVVEPLELLAGADEAHPDVTPARPPAKTAPTAPFAVLIRSSRRDHGGRDAVLRELPEDESMLRDSLLTPNDCATGLERGFERRTFEITVQVPENLQNWRCRS